MAEKINKQKCLHFKLFYKILKVFFFGKYSSFHLFYYEDHEDNRNYFKRKKFKIKHKRYRIWQYTTTTTTNTTTWTTIINQPTNETTATIPQNITITNLYCSFFFLFYFNISIFYTYIIHISQSPNSVQSQNIM